VDGLYDLDQAKDLNVTLLGYPKPILWGSENNKMMITLPLMRPDEVPCSHAWVFKIHHVFM